MQNLKMFSLCLFPRHYSIIKKFNYIPVGLGKSNFDDNWLRDNTGENISEKNPFYGEYTFHYWLWKNHIDEIENETWIGFCGYRYFWKNDKNFGNDRTNVLKNIPEKWKDFEAIVADQQYTYPIKLSKIYKNADPELLLNYRSYIKRKQNIKFHFQVFHGKNSLDNAIDLLNDEDREPFREYVNKNYSFHKWNMFICKSKPKIIKYYSIIFPWLKKCEKIFGFNLDGYGQKRMYGFLAERFLSYWFTKNTKYLSWPVFKLNIDQD